MDDKEIPLVLWLPGDTPPDLTDLTSPVAVQIWYHVDRPNLRDPGRQIHSGSPSIARGEGDV